MSTPISHERCSELLGHYARGSLSDDDSAQVERHLQGCPACRSERAGLAVLLELSGDGLSDLERGELHAAVGQAIEGAPVLTPLKPAERGWRVRLAPALGAAALLGAVLGAYYLASGGGAPEANINGAEAGDALPESTSADQVSNESVGGAGGAHQNAGSGGGASNSSDFAAPAPEPTFSVARDPFTTTELTRLGQSALPMVLFSRAYTGRDAARSREVFLDQLAGRATDAVGERYGSLVKECAHSILKDDVPTLPAFGVMGRLGDDRVMVLGFAWTEDSSGHLDKYDVWAWPKDSCESPVDHRHGLIHAGD